MNFKEILKITLNLVLVFVFAGIVLALVYAKAEPRIVATEKLEKENALKDVVPGAANITAAGTYEPIEGKTAQYYVAKDAQGNIIGYAADCYSKGYKSIISILIGTSKDMRLNSIKVLHEEETPGLGDEIDKQYFQEQYKGKAIGQLEVVKSPDPTKILAVTGATISSRAATKGVKTGLQYLIDKYQGGVTNSEGVSK